MADITTHESTKSILLLVLLQPSHLFENDLLVINTAMKYKISVADTKTLLKNPNPMILDCREVKDYRAGHLEDALHVHEGLKESLVKRGDKQRSLLIYCYYGHASEHLAEFFSDFGFKDVYSLDGGYSSWKDQHQEA
jgi:thiosulfate sulfurtransferase